MTSTADSIEPGPTLAKDQLSVRVLHSFTEAESLRLHWNDLVLRSGADVYQTFDWCRLWWQYYGTRRQLHLLLCFVGEELVGLVPAFIETLWMGPVCLKVAKLVGADFTIQLCNLPVLSEAFPSVISQAIHHFLKKHRCDLFLIGPLSGPAACIDELLAVGRHEREIVARAECLGNSYSTYYHLPNSLDEYLKTLGKSQRHSFNRRSTQFTKAHRVTFSVVSATKEIAAGFEEFCLLHDAQWQAVGKLGHFGSWPHARDFNHNIVRALGDQGLVRFYRILADDKVVFSEFAFVFGDTVYQRLPARVFGPAWDKYGLGAIGFVHTVGSGICEGLKTIEAGRAHYSYKLDLGGHEMPLRTLQFIRHGPGVLARVRMFRASAFLLDLAYYKVIYARLAPRLPALRRPIWPLWIRSTW